MQVYYNNHIAPMQYSAVLSVAFTNEATTEPVTLEEAKAWCAIDGNDFNGIITILIKTAREQCEAYVNLSIITRTVTAKVKAGTPLPYGPANPLTITSVVDLNGNEMISEYQYLTAGTYTVTYPVIPDTRHANKFKTAILNQIAYLFENRGDEGEIKLSPGAKAILKPLKVVV